MSDLLKEAVADAKKVRETALANAQLVLQEAFTPQLQSMLSKKLQAEMEDMEDEEEFDDEDMEGGDELYETNSDETNEIKAEYGEVVNEEEDEDDESYVEDEMDEEYESEDEFEDEEDDGLDLDEIIAELEAELSEEDDEEEFEDEEYMEGGDADDILDDLEGEEDFEDDEDDEEELDLDEILRALDEMEELDDEEDSNEQVAELEARVNELETSLNEHRDVVVFLRSKINEVNLLNAKLLHANKLFRAYNLDNTKKRYVIETLDRTKNTREVKLVYATLAETLSESTTKRSSAKLQTEGFASSPVKSTKPESEEIISESVDAVATRFKHLANIK